MSNNDKTAVDKLHAVYGRMKEEIGQVIVGQQPVIEQVLMAVFCRGHALLVGVPGLAKTARRQAARQGGSATPCSWACRAWPRPCSSRRWRRHST